MRNTYVYFLILVTGFVISCNSQGPSGDKTVTEKEKDIVEVNNSETSVSDSAFMERGEKVYKRVCLACHQSDGSGVPMMYPPVIESEYISGNTDSLIVLILEGLSGPVTVKGEEYNSIMPPMKNVLNNDEISDLINYLRNSFGNTGDYVRAGEVEKLRK